MYSLKKHSSLELLELLTDSMLVTADTIYMF